LKKPSLRDKTRAISLGMTMTNPPAESLQALSKSVNYTPDTLNALFQKHQQSYAQDRTKERLRHHFWHRVALVMLAAWLLCLLLTFIFLSPFLFLLSLAILFVLLFAASKAGGEPNKQYRERENNLAKGHMLQHFFAALRADLHPSSPIKGQWMLQAEDESIAEGEIYRRKTSPHSRSQKFYAKKYWAVFSLTLIDGSQLKIKCWDKVKKKGGYIRNGRQQQGMIVQFAMQGKTTLQINPLLYLPPPHRFQRTLFGKGGISFYETPEAYAHRLLIQLKQQCRDSLKPLSSLSKPSVTPEAQPSDIDTPASELQRWMTLLESSSLPLQSHMLNTQCLQLDYTPPSAAKAESIELYLANAKASEALLRLKIAPADTPARERLLANPCLMTGRFAMMNEQLYLVTLLSVTPGSAFALAAFEDKLVALSQLAQTLETAPLPTKIPAAALPDLTALRQHLRSELSHLKLLAPPQYQENKCKLHLELAGGRKQTVHLRFDRQGPQQTPLLYLLSYCAPENPEHYPMAFSRNAEAFKSALGLVPLGERLYLSVYFALPLHEATQAPLAQYIQEVAERADALELHLTAKDQQ
jgi:hypothetical protein